jgi:ABC-2 type transport system permease protein
MISALFYLQINSIRNRLRARLGRLKHPKYLVGAILGGAYFIFYFSWLVIMPGRGGAGRLLPGAADLGGAQNIGAAILLVVVVAGWVLPNERAALAFSEAEVAFLFPAPITRRGLLHYKLVRSQLGILFSTLFLTLIFGRWRYGGHVWISVLGWWVILSTLNLHLLAFSFARTILFDRGLTNWRRRAIILNGLAVVLGVVGVLSWQSWPAPPKDPQGVGEVWQWLGTVLSSGATPYLLFPFRLVVAPYFAPDAWSFFVALIPALAILALHYIIVMRADVAFEEASAAYSQKLATRIAAAREWRGRGLTPTKARRAPFPLAPVGLPSVAFLWKNLILAGSFFSPRMLLRLGLIGFVVVMMMHRGQGNSDAAQFAGVLCFMLFMMSMFIGQNLLRMDFRMDIRLMDQLKLYPLPGWQVVLGELLAPVVILTVVQWLLILAAASLLTPSGGPAAASFPLGLRVGLALAAALIAPAIDLVMLIIPNAVALVMPSWVRFDKNAPRGIETFGQNMILVFGQMMVLLVAVLPAGLIFWLIFFLAGLLVGPAVAMPLGALAGGAVLAVEGATAIYFLGHAFEHFDLSAELTN